MTRIGGAEEITMIDFATGIPIGGVAGRVVVVVPVPVPIAVEGIGIFRLEVGRAAVIEAGTMAVVGMEGVAERGNAADEVGTSLWMMWGIVHGMGRVMDTRIISRRMMIRLVRGLGAVAAVAVVVVGGGMMVVVGSRGRGMLGVVLGRMGVGCRMVID